MVRLGMPDLLIFAAINSQLLVYGIQFSVYNSQFCILHFTFCLLNSPFTPHLFFVSHFERAYRQALSA